ncbi:hypothetical protein [Nostoc sp.]|uniref:hypothetical protein n=1 Tax=Nostoc sp. TaxID=1180 RepID=UPI002FF94BAB
MKSLIYYLPWRLEVARQEIMGETPCPRTGLATRDFTYLPYGTLRERGLKTLLFH